MSFYSDFDFTFEKETTADVKVVEDEKSINQSIKNILFTRQGEVVFDPDFGSRLNYLLFEKMDVVTEWLLKEEIKFAIDNFEPRISINSITIEPDYSRYAYSVDIDYIILKLDTLGTANISLQLQGV